MQRRVPARSFLRWVSGAALVAVIGACANGGGEPSSASRPTTSHAAASESVPACEPAGRTTRLAGVRVRAFCGPAVAEIRIGTETLRFEGGVCERHDDWLSLNIGFEILDDDPGDVQLDPAFNSFTLLMGRHPLAASDAAAVSLDGVHTEGVVTFALPGRNYLLDDKTITLIGTRSAGLLSGTGFLGEGRDDELLIAGAFTCDSAAIPIERVPEVAATLRTG